MILVSVIMPSLNVEKYIGECLESVTGQILQNMEIICVDAGSTDGTVEIIQKYMKTDQRIRLLHSNVKSYGYQLNLGIDNAKGKYIAIVETDDIVPDNMLEVLWHTAEKNEADFVKAGFLSFGSYGKRRYFSRETRNVPDDMWNTKINLNQRPEIGLCDIDHIWTGLYKKKFLMEKEIKFNETPGASFQDTSFSILVGLLAESCVYIEDVVYQYRIDNTGSSVKSDEKIRCVIDEFSYIENTLKKVGIYTHQIEQLLAHQKIAVYSWNCCRLSWKSAVEFFDLIQDEMQEIQAIIREDELKSYELEQVKLLCSKEYLWEHFILEEERKKKLREVVEVLSSTKDIVLIGAGSYAEQILITREMLGFGKIKAVADNSIHKQGTKLMGYKIDSVEQVVKKYPDSSYLITSKVYSKDIRKQLLEMGIEKESIVEVNAYPGFCGIICSLKEMEDIQ